MITKETATDDAGAAWSLPWHALLRNLASGLGGEAPVHSARPVKSLTVSANSWLQRAQFRAAAVQARQ